MASTVFKQSEKKISLGSKLCLACCTLTLALLATPVAAQYHVTIKAPRTVKKLLKEHLDLARFAKRDDISDEQFDFLVVATPQQVRELVETEGYFSPLIKTDVSSKGDGRKTITVTVDPGLPTKISSVELRFIGPVLSEAPAQEQAVRHAWPLPKGAQFSQKNWDSAKNTALKALQAKRYLSAKITSSQARIDVRHRQAELSVVFDSGPTFTLGPVTVNHLKRYPEKIIHSVNPLQVGEIYSLERVLELQQQIQNTPYFSSVAVEVPHNPEQSKQAPVKVKVSEYPYHSVRGGIGYTTDAGAKAQGQYLYNNMFGRAWVLETQAVLEQRERKGVLQLSAPPDSKGYKNSLLTSYERTNVQKTDLYSLRVGAMRTHTSQHFDQTYSVLLYQDRLEQNNGPSVLSRALVPSLTLVWRAIDDPIFPRHGHIFSISPAFAVKDVLTDQSFGRLYLFGRQYFSLGKNDLVSLRLEAGGVLTDGSADNVPATLRFRAGGSNSIRGYSYQSIGRQSGDAILPTKYLFTASAEYQHWLSRDWGAAVFYDVGTATDNWTQKVMYQGFGIGARWRSPVGPVNLDLAYGVRRRAFQPYLTLGIAF